MALKFKFKTREEIPAEQVCLYTEPDGAWVLDVDGAIEKSKIDDLRTNHAAVTKERDELKQRFGGIDLEHVRALLAERQKADDDKNVKAGEVEKVIENRIKGIKADLEKQVAALTGERDALTSPLTAIQIDQGVVTAATKHGLRATALTNITARARAVSSW